MKTFNEALDKLRRTLCNEDLYQEGQLSIIYHKDDNDFYIAEFPLKSNVYIASNEIDMLNIDIAQLNDMYKDSVAYDSNIEFDDVVDSYLDTAQQEQIYDNEKVILQERT